MRPFTFVSLAFGGWLLYTLGAACSARLSAVLASLP